MADRHNRSVLDELEHDWHRRSIEPAADRRFRRWCALFPELAGHRALPDLVEWCRDRTADVAARDRAQLALVTLAVAGDELAAGAVLQALAPALRRMVSQLAWVGEDRGERTQLIVATAWERIRTYPVARRPGKVAPNILADTRSAVCRYASLTRTGHSSLDSVVDRHDERSDSATVELWRLLGQAVADGVISPASASLIARSRIFDESPDRLGREGEAAQTIRRRRLRAEARLRSAVGGESDVA